jgi:alkylation response protein AidB-like acyl-CoA dehydrogenase
VEYGTDDAAQLAALRSEIRAWLADNAPHDWRAAYPAMSHAEFAQAQRAWFLTLVEGGYAVPHWPAEWPGGGRSLAEQKVIYEELARADTPRLLLSFLTTYHAASTLFECGSEAQQARYLPRMLEGEIWCQGFSEPNAGSDLAGIRTRATRVTRPGGDVYVVSGQKVWSTMAQYADKCLLLARTSSEGAKQAGITFLLMDMKAKGVTVRPINQIQGDQEFCEMFLDYVEVPAEDRVGEEGAGWAVAQATLASERGLTLMELSYRMRGALWRIADLIRSSGRENDAGVLRDFGALVTQIDAACAIADRFLENRMAGIEQVGDASIVKNNYSRALRAYSQLGLRLGGMGEQYIAPITYGDLNTGNWMADFMNSYAWTIAGGSEEIQRNIIAERMLAMPREPKGWTLT